MEVPKSSTAENAASTQLHQVSHCSISVTAYFCLVQTKMSWRTLLIQKGGGGMSGDNFGRENFMRGKFYCLRQCTSKRG